MRVQMKNSILTLMAVVGLMGLGSCNWGGGGKTTPSGPGVINATLKMHLGGSTPTKCTAPTVSWTASSPAGSTQTKTSKAIVDADNEMSKCETYRPIEASSDVTSCYCSVSVSFTSLAPGTWTVQAGGTTGPSCSVKVNPGATSVATLYTDGRACTTFP